RPNSQRRSGHRKVFWPGPAWQSSPSPNRFGATAGRRVHVELATRRSRLDTALFENPGDAARIPLTGRRKTPRPQRADWRWHTAPSAEIEVAGLVAAPPDSRPSGIPGQADWRRLTDEPHPRC